MPEPTPDELWAKLVSYVPRIHGGCWGWTGRRAAFGYGLLTLYEREYRAHRVSWALENGEIPRGIFICHRCDNPPCCNPAHLYAGTPAENMRDKVERGRCNAVRGENNNLAKLTDAQVAEIRALYATRVSQYVIAERYGVTQSCVSRIVTGDTRPEGGNRGRPGVTKLWARGA